MKGKVIELLKEFSADNGTLLAAAISFEITKIIFIWYIRTFDPYNLVYGSIAALIAFVMWTYLSALVFLFIAKVSYVNLEMRTSSTLSALKL